MKNLMCLGISLLAISSFAFAEGTLRFVPDPYQLGEMEQGIVKHVKLGGANRTNHAIEIESAMCQGVGCSHFTFTKKIAPRDPVTVEFDFSTASMEGPVQNLVILVGTDGKPYTVEFEGVVNTPFQMSEKMFDAGYYSAGETRSWTFYVWGSDKKTRPDLELSAEALNEFSLESKDVLLNVDKPEAIKEGGKVPGQKITLKTKGLVQGPNQKQKSISKIVSFKSKAHPNATPEALIIGYWK